MRKSIAPEKRDDIVARVLDDLNNMPLARAQVTASELYSAEGLKQVIDPLLKAALCQALAKKFAGTTASALTFWNTFK